MTVLPIKYHQNSSPRALFKPERHPHKLSHNIFHTTLVHACMCMSRSKDFPIKIYSNTMKGDNADETNSSPLWNQ